MKAMKGLLFMLALLLCISAAQAALVIESVEVNDITVQQGATTRLDVPKGNVLDVQVIFHEDQSDRDDVELQAFVSGFEHNDFEQASARVGPFDIDQNVTYVKNLQVRLSNEFEEDNYLLRVLFTDRNENPIIFQYQLKIDVQRHELNIQDVILSPGNRVEAGRALLATVRLENNGEKDEEDVRVMVSIPALGISASDYIEKIDASTRGDEEETEEMYLSIPRCAEPGTYDLEVVVNYDEGFDQIREVLPIRVDASDSCSLNTGSNRREDDDEEEDDDDNTATARQPSRQDGGVQVVVENTVATPAQPEPVQEESENNVRAVLEVILIILLVILVIVGIVVGVSRLRDNSEDEEEL